MELKCIIFPFPKTGFVVQGALRSLTCISVFFTDPSTASWSHFFFAIISSRLQLEFGVGKLVPPDLEILPCSTCLGSLLLFGEECEAL